MKERNHIIDLWRFIGIVIIMFHHAFLLGVDCNLPFKDLGWIYADFFFILTGYYTYRHFDNDSIKGDHKSAVKYVIRKFAGYFPYSAIAVIAAYLIDALRIRGNGFNAMLGSVVEMPLEVFCMKSEGKVFVLWFLTALLIAFPLFVLFLRIKDKSVVLFVSFSYATAYYVFCFKESMNTIGAVARCFAGLALGAFIGSVLDILLNDFLKKIGRAKLTVAEIVFMVCPVILTGLNIWVPWTLIILFFFLGLCIVLSKLSYTENLGGGAEPCRTSARYRFRCLSFTRLLSVC